MVVFERVVPQERAVVATEPIAPVVPHPSLLRAAGGGLDLAGGGRDADVGAAERQSRAGEVGDRPAEEAARAVDPAIEPILQAVDARLVVVRAETRKELLDDIGLAIAISVLGVEDVR